MYRIIFTKQADKALRKMPRNTAQNIRDKLNRLSTDPYAHIPNAKSLQGRPGYRLRVGDWRVIYEIQDDRLVILVLKIAPCGGAYR